MLAPAQTLDSTVGLTTAPAPSTLPVARHDALAVEGVSE